MNIVGSGDKFDMINNKNFLHNEKKDPKLDRDAHDANETTSNVFNVQKDIEDMNPESLQTLSLGLQENPESKKMMLPLIPMFLKQKEELQDKIAHAREMSANSNLGIYDVLNTEEQIKDEKKLKNNEELIKVYDDILQQLGYIPDIEKTENDNNNLDGERKEENPVSKKNIEYKKPTIETYLIDLENLYKEGNVHGLYTKISTLGYRDLKKLKYRLLKKTEFNHISKVKEGLIQMINKQISLLRIDFNLSRIQNAIDNHKFSTIGEDISVLLDSDNHATLSVDYTQNFKPIYGFVKFFKYLNSLSKIQGDDVLTHVIRQGQQKVKNNFLNRITGEKTKKIFEKYITNTDNNKLNNLSQQTRTTQYGTSYDRLKYLNEQELQSDSNQGKLDDIFMKSSISFSQLIHDIREKKKGSEYMIKAYIKSKQKNGEYSNIDLKTATIHISKSDKENDDIILIKDKGQEIKIGFNKEYNDKNNLMNMISNHNKHVHFDTMIGNQNLQDVIKNMKGNTQEIHQYVLDLLQDTTVDDYTRQDLLYIAIQLDTTDISSRIAYNTIIIKNELQEYISHYGISFLEDEMLENSDGNAYREDLLESQQWQFQKNNTMDYYSGSKLEFFTGLSSKNKLRFLYELPLKDIHEHPLDQYWSPNFYKDFDGVQRGNGEQELQNKEHNREQQHDKQIIYIDGKELSIEYKNNNGMPYVLIDNILYPVDSQGKVTLYNIDSSMIAETYIVRTLQFSSLGNGKMFAHLNTDKKTILYSENNMSDDIMYDIRRWKQLQQYDISTIHDIITKEKAENYINTYNKRLYDISKENRSEERLGYITQTLQQQMSLL